MRSDQPSVAYTAVIQRSGAWWCGWVAEVAGVNGQENSREQLIESLRFALAGAIDKRPEETTLVAGQDLVAMKSKPMKRFDLVQHLLQCGCELAGESERYSWWRNKVTKQRASVPRQGEIAKVVCQKICKDCGIDPLH